MEQQLCAGLASIDITPPAGMELAGYPHYPRHNTGAHDPLMATCLFLTDGKTSAMAIGLDLLFFSKKYVASVRRRIEAATGIPGKNVMFCCSHTHSGPWTSGRLDLESLLSGVRQDSAYIEELCDKITFAAISAYRTAFFCEIGFAKEPCGHEQGIGGNRRDPVGGPCDPNVYVLSVRDMTGTVRGLLVNYAVHPTLLHADNTLCSADYPGYIRACLRENFPHATMVFGIGAIGDQSSRYFRNGQTFGEAKRFGYTIGNAVKNAVQRTVYSKNAAISVRSATVDLKLRKLPSKSDAERRLCEKKAEYEALVARQASYIEIQNANVALLGAEDILGYVLMQEQNRPLELVADELPAEVSLFTVGDIHIANFPGEMFMGIAHMIRQCANVENLIINNITNGCLPGYVYTKEDEALGGYEVDTSLLSPDAGYEMADALLSLFLN